MATLTADGILDQAREIVARDGLRRLQLAALARRLGVVKSALYHYFPAGKAGVVAAMFDREEGRVLAAMQQAAAGATSARTRLLALGESKLAHVVALAELYRVREEIAIEVEGFLVSRRRAFLERERALIAAVVEAGIASGEVRAVDTGAFAIAVQGALSALAMAAAGRRDAVSEGALGELVDILFEGIGGGR